MRISIIVPVLNEERLIRGCLEKIGELDGDFEVIVVDGGSTDGTVQMAGFFERAGSRPVRVMTQIPGGRASQMNAGARSADGEVLLFLHADGELGRSALKSIERCLDNSDVVGGGFYKKYFPENTILKLYRIMLNGIRTRLMKNLVGTNAMFLRRKIFFELGGFPEVELLEDVMLSDRMKNRGRVASLLPHTITSARRYHQSGIWHRIWIAFKIMFLYRCMQVSPAELRRIYTKANGDQPS